MLSELLAAMAIAFTVGVIIAVALGEANPRPCACHCVVPERGFTDWEVEDAHPR